MRGTLKPCIPELQIKDYDTYEAFRCGLARQIAKDYGLLARYMMNSDMVLFAVLADSLAGREGTRSAHCCWHVAGLHKCEMLSQTQGIRTAARTHMLLTWYRLVERATLSRWSYQRLHARILLLALVRQYRKAVADEGGATIDRLLRQESAHCQALQAIVCTDYTLAPMPSENLYAALFLHCASDDASWKALRHAGEMLGRIYFLIRLVAEYDFAKKTDGYNIFIANGLTKTAAIESAKRQCNEAAVEVAKAFALLNIKLNRTLLDNIIYLGLEDAVSNIGKVPSKKKKVAKRRKRTWAKRL